MFYARTGIKKRPFGFSGGAAFMLVFQCLSAQLPFSEDHEDKHHHSVNQCIVHGLEVPYDLVRCKEIVFRRLSLPEYIATFLLHTQSGSFRV